MGVVNVMQSGKTGMMGSRTAIATTGHNITNANTEGFSRQKVEFATKDPYKYHDKAFIGTGVDVARIDRVNDQYLEKQIANSNRELSSLEEKDVLLRHVEDVFNELDGEGLNRLVARYFNEFRKLANDPSSHAIRESVREASQSLVTDFHRMRKEVDQVRDHIDSRIAGYVSEINNLGDQIHQLNSRIRVMDIAGGQPNDLKDKRDLAVKRLASFFDVVTHSDERGNTIVNLKGVGPLVTGDSAEKFSVERSPADSKGKGDNSFDLKTTASAQGVVTHTLKGGKMGAALELRDKTIGVVLDRLDQMAYMLSESVNAVHRQGFDRDGNQGRNFFAQIEKPARAAEQIQLSAEVRGGINAIATSAAIDSPGDNRIALAISGIQNMKLMENGKSTLDDYYNSIVSDVGVLNGRNREAMGQQKNIVNQLGKMREQISGVSLDEETANLLQYQHTFDASAKVIQVADEMLKTVLDLKRL